MALIPLDRNLRVLSAPPVVPVQALRKLLLLLAPREPTLSEPSLIARCVWQVISAMSREALFLSVHLEVMQSQVVRLVLTVLLDIIVQILRKPFRFLVWQELIRVQAPPYALHALLDSVVQIQMALEKSYAAQDISALARKQRALNVLLDSHVLLQRLRP